MFVQRTLILERNSASHARRGAITLWMILIIPAIVLLFGVVVDMSRLWVARIELTNALEAAALSGVKTWENIGDTPTGRETARIHARTAAAANTVTGHGPLVLDENENTSNTNDNNLPSGEILLGRVNISGSPVNFQYNAEPDSGYYFAVRTQRTDLNVASIWTVPSWIFGNAMGPYEITASAVAVYANGQPRIVHVDAVVP
ncbi:MAG TPA: pilus assembly protein TadG-related protein [Planctomicrobium sp.]|nr:pilus assembly protein TadG-related protein [Planctomicrobium sp.]